MAKRTSRPKSKTISTRESPELSIQPCLCAYGFISFTHHCCYWCLQKLGWHFPLWRSFYYKLKADWRTEAPDSGQGTLMSVHLRWLKLCPLLCWLRCVCHLFGPHYITALTACDWQWTWHNNVLLHFQSSPHVECHYASIHTEQLLE